MKEAVRLDLDTRLSLNVLPNAACDDANGIAHTINGAREAGFPPHQLIFELTENERVQDYQALSKCLSKWSAPGIRTAIDDFGAGYAGLSLLVRFQPDFVKIDKALVRNIDRDRVCQVAIDGILMTCRALDLTVIAEGVETEGEMRVLRTIGIRLMQGHFFAPPAVNTPPSITIPDFVNR